MKRRVILETIVAVLVPLTLVILVYNPIFFNPSEYLFSSVGDGVKNYYSLAWFLDHNDSWINHTAMNYPFGEHYLYTDGFFILGWIFRLFDITGVQAIGIVNLLMLLSHVFCAYFLYRILRIYKLPFVLAILGGTAIAILSPQVERMGGHYSLAMSFSFPLTLWLAIKYLKDGKSWLYSILIFLNILFWFFIHPYLGMMATMFLGLVWVIKLVQGKVKGGFSIPWIHLIVQTILPIVLFTSFVSLTDTHDNRPDRPSGFWRANASVKSVFVPTKGPLKESTYSIIDMKKVPWETKSYIGLATIALLVYLLIRFIITRKMDLHEDKSGNPNFLIFFIPSVIILIFSFGIPFHQFPSLVELLPPVRNFRALGRFSWVFFYIATLFVLIKVYQQLNQNYRAITWVVILLYCGLTISEGVSTHLNVSKRLKKTPNYFNPKNVPAELQKLIEKAKAGNYLALMPLPYYHVGSEWYIIKAKKDVLFNSILVSYHAELPVLSNQLARTSITESIKGIMLVSPNYYDREICDEMDDGDVLVMNSGNELKEIEKSYIDQAELVVKTDNHILSSLSVSKLAKTTKSVKIQRDSLRSLSHNIFFDETRLPIFYKNYRDSLVEGLELIGRHNRLLEFTSEDKKVGEYEIKIWYRNVGKNRPNTAFFVETKNNDGTDGKWESFATFDKATIFSGDSLLFSKNFKISDPNREYKIVLKQSKNEPADLRILDLLIRPLEINVYRVDGDSVSVNNHRMIKLD